MLRVRDIMTRDVVTVPRTATLRDVMELLVDRHLSGVPVMDGDSVVGVVSITDLLGFTSTTAAADQLDTDDEERTAWDDEGVEPEEEDESAGSFFAEAWAEHDRDVLSQVDTGANGRRDVFSEHTVAELMTTDLYTVVATATVPVAAERMRRANVHRLLVLDATRLAGIVTTTDIARAAADNKLGSRSYVFLGHR